MPKCEVLNPPLPKRKIERPRKDGGGQHILDQFPSLRPAIPGRDGAPPISEYGGQDGAPPGSQSGGLVVTPIKRTKMMTRGGAKAKLSAPRNQTPKKAYGNQPIIQGGEDVSLRCDEAFDDLFNPYTKW